MAYFFYKVLLDEAQKIFPNSFKTFVLFIRPSCNVFSQGNKILNFRLFALKWFVLNHSKIIKKSFLSLV